MSSGDGFFLEKLMILVIFFPAARLIDPFRSARPLFLPFPGRTQLLCDPAACPGIPAVGTQLELAGWAVGTGTVPCSPCSLRVAGDPVSPMATLSESEVCFSWDSRCGRAESHQQHPPATASPSSPSQGWDIQLLFPFPALQSCCENGKGSWCRNLGFSSPVLPRFVHTGSSEIITLSSSILHGITGEVGASIPPAAGLLASFITCTNSPSCHLRMTRGPGLPSLAQLLHYQSQAEPAGQVLVPRAQGSKPRLALLTPWPLQNFRDIGHLTGETLRCQSHIILPAQDTL